MSKSTNPFLPCIAACVALMFFASPLAAQTGIDLSMSEVGVDNNVTYPAGTAILIEAEVDNVGSMSSAAYSVSFYISTDSTITSGDVLLTTANRAALGAGNSDNFSVSPAIPQGLPAGNYFVGAIINIDDDQNANNTNLEDEAVTIANAAVAFVINNGLNDAWFDSTTLGQGFFITVFPNLQSVFLAWFTYDTERPPANVEAILGEPGHRWLTAFGGYTGTIATLEVELTQGGVFDSAEPAVQQTAYGTIQVEFLDCNSAIVRYNFPSLGLNGEIPISRIADDNVPACLAAQPQ